MLIALLAILCLTGCATPQPVETAAKTTITPIPCNADNCGKNPS